MGRVVVVERRPHLSGDLTAGNVVVAATAGGTVEDGGIALADLPEIDGDGVIKLPEQGGIVFTDAALAQDAEMYIRSSSFGHNVLNVNANGVDAEAIVNGGGSATLISGGSAVTAIAAGGVSIDSGDGPLSLDGSGTGAGVSIAGGLTGVAINGNTTITGALSAVSLDLTGGVPVAVADGGTGATSAAAARTNLGIVTDGGTDTVLADTTLVSTGAVVTLATGVTYQILGVVCVTSPSADDSKFAIVSTGTISGFVHWSWGNSVQSVALDGTATPLIPTGGTQELKAFHGVAVCTSTGTLTLQAAKFADTGVDGSITGALTWLCAIPMN